MRMRLPISPVTLLRRRWRRGWLGVVLAVAALSVVWFPAGARADSLPRSEVDRPDDFKGPQVHVVYAIPSDGQDRALDTNGTIVNSVAGFQAWLSGQTAGRTLRTDTAGGAVDVSFLRLSMTDAQMKAQDPFIVDEIQRRLRDAGFTKKDKIYSVYYDGTSTYACGGAAWPPVLPGQVAAMYLRGDPDPPGGVVCAQDPSDAYWQFAMLHDTLHAAGFVARCAPHHNPTHQGHVSGPPNDLMYGRADENDPNWDTSGLELDVGRDDYYEHRDEDCRDLADSPYLSPRLPAGNLTTNPSFELDTTGWGTRQGTLARVATAGAPHGDFALKVSASTGSTMAFASDCPVGIGCSVASATAGATYVASAYVRAVSGSWIGSPFAAPVTIVLSEYAQNGMLLNETVGEAVTPTSSFRHLAVAARPKAAYHVIGVRLQQNRPAVGDAFLADLITLTEARTVMRVFGGPLGAPVAWTPVGVNTKRVSEAPLTTSEPADLVRLSVVLDGGGAPGVTGQPLRGVVYSDANGEPGALLGRTAEVTIAPGQSVGAVNLEFRPPLHVLPGRYWLGLHAGGATATARYASTGGLGGLRFKPDSYADGTADPFGASNSGTAAIPIQAIGG
jgi:hypothetical protein